MSTNKTIFSFAIILVACVLIVLVTHNWVNVIYPMIGGFFALKIFKKIEPDVEALKSDPKALRKPVK